MVVRYGGLLRKGKLGGWGFLARAPKGYRHKSPGWGDVVWRQLEEMGGQRGPERRKSSSPRTG